MKCLTIVGARPQFIKVAPVSAALADKKVEEVLIHTGQHFDYEMSQVFFDQLNIPPPQYSLGIGGGSHGDMTGRMLMAIEPVIKEEMPDWVVVYGDTNSTLAGALASSKLNIPIAHIEAGLRSYNRRMPEEINRVVVDHLASLLLCPSQVAVDHLATEGLSRNVELVGDVMADASRNARQIVERDLAEFLPSNSQLDGLNDFDLLTLHRAENTDDPNRLRAIIDGLTHSKRKILFPIHPRTQNALDCNRISLPEHFVVHSPLSYLALTAALLKCSRVFTDSGGLQKEAYWAKKPCVTLREETEWVETLAGGANILVGASASRIQKAMSVDTEVCFQDGLYGDGYAADRCVEALLSFGASLEIA